MPSGHTVGFLPLDRVQLLYRACTARNKVLIVPLSSFGKPLIRSRPSRAKGARPLGSGCPGAPTEVDTSLHICLQLQTELFSSPLTFGSRTRSYYSCCTADRLSEPTSTATIESGVESHTVVQMKTTRTWTSCTLSHSDRSGLAAAVSHCLDTASKILDGIQALA